MLLQSVPIQTSRLPLFDAVARLARPDWLRVTRMLTLVLQSQRALLKKREASKSERFEPAGYWTRMKKSLAAKSEVPASCAAARPAVSRVAAAAARSRAGR